MKLFAHFGSIKFFVEGSEILAIEQFDKFLKVLKNLKEYNIRDEDITVITDKEISSGS